MVPFLGPDDPLPSPRLARRSPNGLLAAGGGLAVPRLLEAYRIGVFPWFDDDDPVLWWCPDPRMILPTDGVHVSRSLARRLARADVRITIDAAFEAVMRACAEPRGHERETWITASMVEAYVALHRVGVAHSLEVWSESALVGGIYGVAIGRAFFGESMFSRVTDGSKMAIAWLAAHLRAWGVPFIDCQLPSPHLASLGARPVARAEFLARLAPLVEMPPSAAAWRVDPALGGASVVATLRLPPYLPPL